MKTISEYFEPHIKLGYGVSDAQDYGVLGKSIYLHNSIDNCDRVAVCQNGIFVKKKDSEYKFLYSDFDSISGFLTLPELSKKAPSDAITITFHMKSGSAVEITIDKFLYSTFFGFFTHYVGI